MTMHNQEKLWRYHQEENSAVFDGHSARIAWLFRQATARFGKKHIRVLDIGIGNGALEELCKGHRWQVSAVDIVPETVQRMRSRGIDASVSDISEMPHASNSMDVVFCSEVLEHLTPSIRERGLAEIHRILRDDGLLIGSVPVNEILSATTTVCPDCSRIFHPSGHLKSYTTETIREELEGSGFVIDRQYVSSFLDFSRQHAIGKLLLVPFWILGRMGRGFAPTMCGFVARKYPLFRVDVTG